MDDDETTERKDSANDHAQARHDHEAKQYPPWQVDARHWRREPNLGLSGG